MVPTFLRVTSASYAYRGRREYCPIGTAAPGDESRGIVVDDIATDLAGLAGVVGDRQADPDSFMSPRGTGLLELSTRTTLQPSTLSGPGGTDFQMAKGDAALRQIIRGQLERDAVPSDYSDVVLPNFACGVGD